MELQLWKNEVIHRCPWMILVAPPADSLQAAFFKLKVLASIFCEHPRAKTTYKLLRSTKNVANITKALNVRENLKQKTYLVLIGKFFSVVKMTLCDICEGWVKSWFWMDYPTPQPPAFLDQPPLCITHPWILKFFQNSHNSVFWTLHTPPLPPH